MEKKYKIHEAAERIGISASSIRYYEEKGMIRTEKDPENGYRYFTEADIFKIWLITFHRAMNMSLGDIGVLMHGFNLEETADAIADHREKTLRVLEQAKRTLEICDFYDRYIAMAGRDGDPPMIVDRKRFYLYEGTDIFRREKPSFPACTFGSIFSDGKEEQYSIVCEEDMYLLSEEEQKAYIRELVLTDMLSVVVTVDDNSFGAEALQKALQIAKDKGYDVCEPYYSLYLISIGEMDALDYRYEILMTLQKGS